jgi:insertion element IS1 protein InsB
VTHAVGKRLAPEPVAGERCRAEELAQRRGLSSARDALWSAVSKQAEPRWLWHALAPHRGAVFASVLGRRQEEVVLAWQERLAPLHLTRFSPDGWGAYERSSDPAQHPLGKAQTQQSASKPSNVRTRRKRLVRRTSCFAKPTTMHALVRGLFSNRDELGEPSNEESTDLKHLPLLLQEA